MGRPKLNIDPELVQRLASIQCTNSEIAAVCKCSTDTIEIRFSAELAKGREEGKKTLREGLWELAKRGNLGALIWLSKQHLGMSEKIEEKQEIKGHQEVVVYATKWGGQIESDDSNEAT